MDTKKILTIMATVLLCALGLKAQKNTLSTPDVVMGAGREVPLPINLDNTSDIVAAQFTITIPDGLTVREDGICTTVRSSTHDISFSKKSDGSYKVILLASDNSMFRGRTGSIMTIPILSDENLKEGTFMQPLFSDVAIVTRNGSNVTTGYSNGTVTISPTPDLLVKDIHTDITEITPGENIIVNWTVENIGSVATEGGWSEQISLISNEGVDKVLASSYYDSILNAKGLVSRSVDIQIPKILGIDGHAKVSVKLIPNRNAGEPSWLLANNVASTETDLNVRKRLTLSPDSVSIEETTNGTLRFLLSRSGNVSSAESFKIESITDSRISIPSEIEIPEGQAAVYVYPTIMANGKLDDTPISILGISGNGYPSVSSVINIEDDKEPTLTLSFNKDEVTEGEIIELKIQAERPPKEDLEIYLSCELPSRFEYPTIILPSGQSEINVSISVKEDDVPDVTQSVQFTAWANGYAKATGIIDLLDNDVPTLQFSLMPQAISEGAGLTSIAGKLIRTDNIDKAVTIKLSDDSEGNLYYGRESIMMSPGIKEAIVNLGPIDNSIVDVERTYNITAAVWIASCSCSTSGGTSGGQVTVPLTIYDDDGPSLAMASSTSVLKEGSEMSVTISRNTDSTEALTVNISSDHNAQLEYPTEITIPAGSTSANFIVKSIKSEVDNADITVVLTAQTEGYAKSNIWFMISDQTLPDAQIADLSLSEKEIEIGQPVVLTATIVNHGSYLLPEMTQVNFYRKGNDKPLATAYLQSDLLPEERVSIEKEIDLPNAVSSYKLYAVVNENRHIKEILYSNNASTNVEVKVKSPYSFTIYTDKDIYRQNEVVQITGSIKGKDVANKEIDVYIINDGYRHVLRAVSDNNGDFQVNYEPYAGQMGYFTVGACYPNEHVSDKYASFEIYGMKRASNQPIYCKIDLGDDYNGKITLSNPGNLPLTGLELKVISAPDDCILNFDCPTELSGKSKGNISFRLTPSKISEGNDWQSIVIGVNSNEGTTMTIPVYYYCYNKEGKIKSSVSSIKTSMVKDGIRDYPFEIANVGKGSTGKITLALPNWMAAATPMEMAPLNNGESTTVILRLAPTDEMQINVPVTGTIGIKCEKGEGTVIPFSIEPVSDAKGILTIDVCDENTYYTEQAPHLAGAEVIITHPTTGALITSGVTDDHGKFSATLNEGYYAVSVSAPKHDQYSNYVLVDPSSEKNLTVNLSINGISVGLNWEQTDIQDEYNLVTTVNYETNVPIPVVELNVPNYIPAKELGEGESLIFNAILTNKGLITAHDVEFIAPEGFKSLTFEPLSNTEPFSLAPQQSVLIPVKVTRKKNENAKKATPIDDDPCVAMPGTLYFWDCGLDRKWHRYSIALQVGSCNSKDPRPWENPGDGKGEITDPIGLPIGGGWRPLPHTGFGGGYYYPTTTNNTLSTRVDRGCEPCQNEFLLNTIDCTLQLIPVYKKLKSAISCAISVKKAIDIAQDEFSYDKPDTMKLLGAVKQALGSCLSAILGFSGESVEKTIGEIYAALTQLEGSLLQGDAGWDDAVEVLGTLAQNLTDIILGKGEYENLEEMICFLKLLKPCDKEGSGSVTPSRINSMDKTSTANTDPSYIQEFKKALILPFIDQIAVSSMQLEFFGSPNWLDADPVQLSDFFDVFNSLQDENDCIPEEYYKTLIAAKPENVSKKEARQFIDRWNNTLLDEFTDNTIDLDRILLSYDIFEMVDSLVSKVGYDSFADYVEDEYEKYRNEAEIVNNSVCSSITLQFNQNMVMTRQAFRGTLSVFNGNEAVEMNDVKLSLSIKDTEGNLATSHEFQINPESLSGFEGNLSLSDGWSLGANETGTATILVIPTKYAAPTVDKAYRFGGTLSYVDPFTGLTVTRDLNPVTLTVSPSPVLNLTYFLQRDVIGDDPLTEAVEPIEEAEFSLLIHNVGYGDATNIRMQTQQPEVIQNDKGLVNDFKFVSSQLNGQEKTLVLGATVPTEFGDIKPQETAYAQWWFTNSLLGHFNKYDIEVNHVTSYGNPDLSLLDKVNILELIRSLECERDGKKLVGFMTNDIQDSNDTPDMIYLSNGEIEDVHSASDICLDKVSENQYVLTVTPGKQGWNYANIIDPTYGVSRIMTAVRKSDGKSISLRNIWQTDRTLRDGNDPLYENRIHFADEMLSVGTEEYELTFSPAPKLQLEVAAIEGTPSEGTPAGAPIDALNVMFNKHIDPATFTADDIDMTVQGRRIDTDAIAISTEDSKTFRLDLSKLEQGEPGYYTMTVRTADIMDAEGFAGKDGKTVGWSYFPDGKVSTSIEVYPENSGKVTQTIDGNEIPVAPSAVIRTPYGENVTFTAVPEEGYEFAEWMNSDQTLSLKDRIDFLAISNSELTAEFTPKTYSVEVDPFCKGGSIIGTSTGYYSFGEDLPFIAVPEEGYLFKNWTVNGEETDADQTFSLTVKGETKISAVFIEDTSGVGSYISRRKIVIYSIDGILIDSDATLETIERLEKGVYIINGVKCLIQ